MKLSIGGELVDFEFDLAHVKMATALAIEKAAGRRYVEWETEVVNGSAEAMCALIWLAWQRDGRDVPLEDITGGKLDLDFSETYRSFMDGLAAQARAAQAEENPTSGAAPRTAPDGTPTTPSATKGRSPKSST